MVKKKLRFHLRWNLRGVIILFIDSNQGYNYADKLKFLLSGAGARSWKKYATL